MIILGVDPGLTRCGVGVIEAGAYRRLSFIHVDVVRSDPKTSQDLRLLAIISGETPPVLDGHQRVPSAAFDDHAAPGMWSVSLILTLMTLTHG